MVEERKREGMGTPSGEKMVVRPEVILIKWLVIG